MGIVNLGIIALKDTVDILRILPAVPALQVAPMFNAGMMENANLEKIALKDIVRKVAHAMAFVDTMLFVNQHMEENIEAFLPPVNYSVHSNQKALARVHLAMKEILT